LEKGINPAVRVEIAEENVLREKARQAKAINTLAGRNESLAVRKILDYIEKLKMELPEKIRLLYYANLYPVKSDFTTLATCFRQILKLSFNGQRLFDETALTELLPATNDRTRALKYEGIRKIDCMQSGNAKLGFSIQLTEEEYGKLKSKMPASIDPRDMFFYGLECGDLDAQVLVEKAIPAFIDRVYDMKKGGMIAGDDNRSWAYLPSYRLGMG
jgi:hypothetical protein